MSRLVVLGDAVHEHGLSSFGLAILKNVGRKAAAARLEQAKPAAVEELERQREQIRCRMRCYDASFAAFGYQSPLPAQFQRTLDRGLPTVNRYVDTMFLCEMATGVLLGAQDYGCMSGTLSVGVAGAGETYEGMRQSCHLKEGEIVIRDAEGIVASYYQGSDKRTAITRQTSDVVFFGFGAPGVARNDVEGALRRAVELLGPASESAAMEML